MAHAITDVGWGTFWKEDLTPNRIGNRFRCLYSCLYGESVFIRTECRPERAVQCGMYASKERQAMRCIRLLITLLLVLAQPGCWDEVESSTYPMGQTGKTCTAYKGFDPHPPEVVVAELARRGLDGRRLIHKTVCGSITNWEILPAGSSINRIPPPDSYVNVWMGEDGSVSVSTDRP